MTAVTLPRGKVTILYGKDGGGEYIIGIFASNKLAQEKMLHLEKITGRAYWVRDFGVIVE